MTDSFVRLKVFSVLTSIGRFTDRILAARIPHRAPVDLWEPGRKRNWR